MRSRSVSFTLIAILWMMLSPIATAIAVFDDGVVVNDKYDYTLSVDECESNLTWTSRIEHTPQLVENYSVVAGDHVIINGTFSELPNVTECVLTIWNPETGNNATVSNVGSSITFDTYYLDRTNQTYYIMVNGTTNTNDFVIIFRENVTICNFFAPVVTVNAMVEIGDDTRIWNLTWSSTDANADDTPYYSVWLSRDAGVTFVLLTHNISSCCYLWNSTDWLEADYSVRVRAYSVDMTSSECSFDDPPTSYWPGDYSDGYSSIFYSNGPPRVYSLYVSSVDDVTYNYGSLDNSVSLTLYSSFNYPPSLDYIVRSNGSIWFESSVSIRAVTELFDINIDNLPIGVHLIEVEFLIVDPVVVSFKIEVLESPVAPFITLSITVGAIGGVAVIVIFAIYMKTKKKG